jgi:tetratricopeptide (TPR) repeat protein
MKKIYIILVLVSLLWACNPSKQYIKKGNEFFLLGNYDDAATYFYNALLADPQNLEAKQALKKSANNVLTAKFSQFGKYVVENRDADAVRQYRSNQKYFEKTKSVGVELDWPSMYDEVYLEIKNEYIAKLYSDGLQLMKDNKYDKAEANFSEIAEIDPGYKDATVLRMNTILEPMYQNGMKMLQLENYKEAYKNFDKVYLQDKSYKDVKALREAALGKATVGVGVLPVQNQTRSRNFDTKLYQDIISQMVKGKSPFLKVVERSSLERMLNEQQLGMSGMVDPETAAQAGKIIGLKYVLMSAWSEWDMDQVRPTIDSIEAYEAYVESIPETAPGQMRSITRFKKVKYARHYQKNRVYARVFYQLVSTQTSQIVASEVIAEEKSDEYERFVFKGNVSNLYPELPKGNTLPPAPREWREKFGKTSGTIVSQEELANKLSQTIAIKMADEVRLYVER